MTIGSLRGILTIKEESEMILEVAGVGYRIQISPSTLESTGPVGEETLIYIHHHFREDNQILYGFIARTECLFFEALISTHGVGPSLGLSILSTHSPNQLAQILVDEDSEALCLVPGIGKKTATRLIVELQSKIDFASISLNGQGRNGYDTATENSTLKDVRDALSGLGYGNDEIQVAMKNLPSNTDSSLLLKLALQELATVT